VKKFLAYKVAYENALNGPADISLAEYWKGNNKSWSDISKETGVTTAELENYNKWLRKGKIPTDKSYAVVLPVTSAVRLPMDQGEPSIGSNRTLNGVPKKGYAVDYEFTPESAFPEYKNMNEARLGKITTINGRPAVMARPGDRAASLASKGDLSLQRFLKYNDMDIQDRIEPGQIYYLKKKKSKQEAVHHVVKDGETMWSISQKYGIRKSQLLTRNRMRKDAPLKPGRILWLRSIRPANVPAEFIHPEVPKVPVIVKKDATRARENIAEHNVEFADDESGSIEILTKESGEEIPAWPESTRAEEVSPVKVASVPPAGAKEKIHVVKPGETLYSISRNYSVKIDDLLEWNGLSITDPISIDQKLKLYQSEETVTEKKTENAEIYYTVQQGDTFYSISRRYNLTVKELKELNSKTDDILKPGERLKVR
jgi:membrane-bound lytic murein transglycosylase D